MKYIFNIILFLFCLQLSFAQDKPEDGPYKEYYESGEVKIEGYYENKKRVDEWKRYHKNGQVARIYSYVDGKLNKEQISFFKNGKVSNKTEKVGNDYIMYGYFESGELEYERKRTTGYYLCQRTVHPSHSNTFCLK